MKKTRAAAIISAVAVAAVGVSAALLYFGVWHINRIDSSKYPTVGVDVSRYQGEIDWERLSGEGLSFAFIKATEGSKHVDPRFDYNWSAAAATDLRIGAYHFFSFESAGESQAELFCSTVKAVDGMLPPVVDVEFYGSFRSENDIDADEVKAQLRAFIDRVEREYSVKPIIYATKNSYYALIADDFDDCDLWFRSVYSGVPDGIDWTFWQYSNRHVLEGYSGQERYIDMNVFNGSQADFAAYGRG